MENFEAADSITRAASVPLPNGDAPGTERADGADSPFAPPSPTFTAPEPIFSGPDPTSPPPS